MTYLLDVNILLALAWTPHLHHAAASRWFAGKQFATCPITQLGFLRISTTLGQTGYAGNVEDARRALDSIVQANAHTFWPDQLAPVSIPLPSTSKQLTDSYLVALARHNRGKLATFDQGITGPHVELLA